MIIMKIFASPSSTTSWRIAKSFLGKRGEVCLKTVLGEKLQWQWILEAQELLWSLGKSLPMGRALLVHGILKTSVQRTGGDRTRRRDYKRKNVIIDSSDNCGHSAATWGRRCDKCHSRNFLKCLSLIQLALFIRRPRQELDKWARPHLQPPATTTAPEYSRKTN